MLTMLQQNFPWMLLVAVLTAGLFWLFRPRAQA